MNMKRLEGKRFEATGQQLMSCHSRKEDGANVLRITR